MTRIPVALLVILWASGVIAADGRTTAPAMQPGDTGLLMGPDGGLLPGAKTSLAEAMKDEVTLVAVCQAVGPPRLVPGYSGIVYATQTFRLIDRMYEHEKVGETLSIRYSYLQPGMGLGQTFRAVRADEKVIWILRHYSGGDYGVKVLPDSPENRLAAKDLVRQFPAHLRDTVATAKAEARLADRFFAIKPHGWSGGSMRQDRVEPNGWDAGKGMEFVWTRMTEKADRMFGRMTVWIMDEGYSGRRSEDAGNPAEEITTWRRRRVFLFGNGEIWPTAKDDILRAVKEEDSAATTVPGNAALAPTTAPSSSAPLRDQAAMMAALSGHGAQTVDPTDEIYPLLLARQTEITGMYERDATSVPRFQKWVEIDSAAARRLFPGLRFACIQWDEAADPRAKDRPVSRALGLQTTLAVDPKAGSVVATLAGHGNFEAFGILLIESKVVLRDEADAKLIWDAFCDLHCKAWKGQPHERFSDTEWRLGRSSYDQVIASYAGFKTVVTRTRYTRVRMDSKANRVLSWESVVETSNERKIPVKAE